MWNSRGCNSAFLPREYRRMHGTDLKPSAVWSPRIESAQRNFCSAGDLGRIEFHFGGIKEQCQDWFDNIGCFMVTVIWAARADGSKTVHRNNSIFQHIIFGHIESPYWESWKVRISSDDFRVRSWEYPDWYPTIFEILYFKIAFQWIIHTLHTFFFGVPWGLQRYPDFHPDPPLRFVLC
jgi:hypothetical protein